MNLKEIFKTSLFILIASIAFLSNAKANENNSPPKAIIKKTVYEFSPVIAGTEVIHSFSIVNKGGTPLNIPGVYAG
jgi:hypothetical protein